ncbi:glutathione S-transferase family protein, partial [bacterium]|nr:glutathione S-transferase family protein [bacterium]
MENKIIIYSYRRCPFAMRVRMALHEKKLAFEVVEEDLKNFSEKLRSLHPEAKVPVLTHGTRVLYESAIITEYVDDLPSSQPRLMPMDPGERAEVRLWTYWCNHPFKLDLDKFKYGVSRFSEAECLGA